MVSRLDQKDGASVQRSAAERILNPAGVNRLKLLHKSGGEEATLKVGATAAADLEAKGAPRDFKRDSVYNALAEKTHTEIFRTDKDAVKKQINFSNYSLHPSHLISNQPVEGDSVMRPYVNDKIMDYKTPFVEELRSSIRDHNVQINEKFHFNNGRLSVSTRNAMNGSLAMSNLKNGSSHVPVAPSNPHKTLFRGQSIGVDEYKQIVENRKNNDQERQSWLKKNAKDVRYASQANRGKYQLRDDLFVGTAATPLDS